MGSPTVSPHTGVAVCEGQQWLGQSQGIKHSTSSLCELDSLVGIYAEYSQDHPQVQRHIVKIQNSVQRLYSSLSFLEGKYTGELSELDMGVKSRGKQAQASKGPVLIVLRKTGFILV